MTRVDIIRWRVTWRPVVRRLVRVLQRQVSAEASRFLARHLSNVEHHVDYPLTDGNGVRLLDDAPRAFDAMIEAIDGAFHHVHCETFTFDTSELARRFLDALVRARRRGVRVRVLYDGVGSLRTSDAFFEPLTAIGGEVIAFNPLNPFRGARFRPFERNHRKLLIVDGRTAFTGGMNVCRKYADPHREGGSWRGHRAWRDLHARIDGPAVAQFQQAFARLWSAQRPEGFADDRYFPPLAPAGDALVHVLEGHPLGSRSPTHRVILSALRSARRSIDVIVPYFVPDRAIVRALCRAAGRGVRVRLLIPERSDVWATAFAGRHFYRPLTRAGVAVYERGDVFIHAKMMVVDDVWCTLGSCNWDSRSLRDNHELNAMVVSPRVAGELTALFEREIATAVAHTYQGCSRWPAFAFLRCRFAAAFWRLL